MRIPPTVSHAEPSDHFSGDESPTGSPGPDRREAILRAALELFAERTYGATAVPAIAARANVGAGTVYRHFEGKEALANEVFRECKRAMQRSLRGALSLEAESKTRFLALWRGLADFATRHPSALRFLELQHHEEYLDDESRRVSDEVFGDAAGFLRSAQAAGDVRAEDPRVLIALVFGAFVGLVKESCAGRFAFDEAVVVESGALAWRMISA
jgi:AcrR family transcriptional regulator